MKGPNPQEFDKIRALIDGFGVIAELVKIQYDSFEKAGFSHDDALYLSATCLKQLLDANLNRGKPEE